MKIRFTILILFLSIFSLRSQVYVYKSILDTGLEWHDLYWHNSGPPSHTSIYTLETNHFTGKDTLINAKLYHQHTNGLFYADSGKRFYCFDTFLQKDLLIYDFNAHAGDTLFTNYQYNTNDSSKSYYYIDSTDTLLINNTLRRRLFVSTNVSDWAGQKFKLTWIEGIGNTYFGIRGIFSERLYFYADLCGVYESGSRVYPDTITNPECDRVLDIKETSLNKLIIYPVPAADYIMIRGDLLKFKRNCSLIDLYGKIVKELSIDNDRISLKAIPAGIYFLSLFDLNGNAYLQKILKK